MKPTGLETRIQRIEDIEAIKKLRAKYCYAVDEKRLDDVMTLFSDNAKLDFWPSHQCDMQEDIRRFYGESVPSRLPFFMHMAQNAVVDVEGETGTRVWYVLLPATSGQTGEATWSAGKYDETYVKIDGEWRFSSIKCSVYFSAPYQEGWAGKFNV